METNFYRKYIGWGLIISFILIFSSESRAIPSFARQTNLSCGACHTIFPELNAYGRLFKLNGYTLVGSETIKVADTNDNVSLNLVKFPPVSLMLQASYTYNTTPIPGTQNSDVSLPQQLSVFFGGEITPNIGSFIQVTYDDQSAAFGMDNADIRYADQTQIGSSNLIYGVTLNNNPTVQDVWNSTPAWGFPFASSPVAVSPITSTLIEGGLAQSVAGLGAYALYDDLIYGELSFYRSAHQGGVHPPDSTSFGIIKSLAPYWRLALQKQFKNQYVEIGAFGMSTKMYPAGVSGLTDTYTDIGFDLNYEKPMDENMFTAHASYIMEKRTLDATFNAGGSLNQSLNLSSLKITGNYYLHQQIGFTLAYFSVAGDGDAAMYAPGAITGSNSGSPNSSGFIGEFSYLPWLNTKFSIQYVAYSNFNGSSSNYDGSGRNASDNNSVYLLAWLVF